jgi:2-keto-4-pentenoate hydratase/2-oxohepta-3-ene-1,7-dioic acid hydratase in catechol pathway
MTTQGLIFGRRQGVKIRATLTRCRGKSIYPGQSGQSVEFPSYSRALDYELQLAFVIGGQITGDHRA